MKVRIQGNSVRVRLTQGEVRSLADGQPIEQRTEFSESSRLVTHIEPSGEAGRAMATFDNGQLTLQLPDDEVRRWADTDRVSMESDQPIGGGRSLHILVEKDFTCLHPRLDDGDTFPNPQHDADS